jgi:hypothetical protein
VNPPAAAAGAMVRATVKRSARYLSGTVHVTWNSEFGPGGGGGPFAGDIGGASHTTFTGTTPLGHPIAAILANRLDSHMFVALIGTSGSMAGGAGRLAKPAMRREVAPSGLGRSTIAIPFSKGGRR